MEIILALNTAVIYSALYLHAQSIDRSAEKIAAAIRAEKGVVL